jgi:hypothetical protein
MASASLPSIISTYQRVGKLYAKGYVDVLPFTLLFVILEYVIDKGLPLPIPQQSFNAHFLANTLLQFFVSLLFFNFILYGMFQKHHNLKFDYVDVLQRGVMRLLPVILALLMMISPIIIIGFMAGFIDAFIADISSLAGLGKILMACFYIICLFISLATAVFCIYFYVSTLLIVVKKTSALEGLKQSWKLIRGHWFKTFGLLLIIIILSLLLNFILHKVVGSVSKELVNVLLYPLGGALMVIYYEHLETAFNS